jgi:hypothetical protein
LDKAAIGRYDAETTRRHRPAPRGFAGARPNPRGMNMDEFGGGGFLRSLMIGFVLAVAVSFIYVWYR